MKTQKTFCGFVRYNRKLGMVLAFVVFLCGCGDKATYDIVYKDAFETGYQIGLREKAVFINTHPSPIFVENDSLRNTTGIYIGKKEPMNIYAGMTIIIPDSTTTITLSKVHISRVDTGVVVK